MTKEKEAFSEPSSIADAERERLELVERLQEIQVQLGDRNRIDPETGQRISEHDFWTWRSRACAAQRHVQKRLQRVNAWLKTQRLMLNTRLKTRELPADLNDPKELLIAAHNVISGMARDGVNLDDHEQAVADAIRNYLQHGPVAHATER